MKILVLADSHGFPDLMRCAVNRIRPDAIIHLGDFFDDGELLREENLHIVIHQVPGNCDKDRMYQPRPEVLCYPVCGVKLFMTHGHNHFVKNGTYYLLADAREAGAQAVLYGHTHTPDCRHVDGLWIFNPGSCRNLNGSVGLIEVKNGEICSCRILRQVDLEEML